MLIYNRMIKGKYFYLIFYIEIFGLNVFIPIFAPTKQRPRGATE